MLAFVVVGPVCCVYGFSNATVFYSHIGGPLYSPDAHRGAGARIRLAARPLSPNKKGAVLPNRASAVWAHPARQMGKLAEATQGPRVPLVDRTQTEVHACT